MRGTLAGAAEKANQRSPSQRREQAGESHGRPRKSRDVPSVGRTAVFMSVEGGCDETDRGGIRPEPADPGTGRGDGRLHGERLVRRNRNAKVAAFYSNMVRL